MITTKNEKISVCIPAYNEEKYIMQCLKSIVQQEDVDISEILVGINSSTDRTRELVDVFGKEYPIVKAIDSPKGKIYAWNSLNREAQCDIRVFQDGDSIAPKNAYAELLLLLSDADIVGGCIEKKLQSLNLLVRIANFPRRHAFLQPKLNGCLYAFRNSVILRHMKEKIGAIEMPVDLINDDAFLDMVTDNLIVSDKVFTLVDAENNFSEILKRYIRMRHGQQQLKMRYPNLYNVKLTPFNKGKPVDYYSNLFHLSDPLEKVLFFPFMMFKYFLFLYVTIMVNRNMEKHSSVDWK